MVKFRLPGRIESAGNCQMAGPAGAGGALHARIGRPRAIWIGGPWQSQQVARRPESPLLRPVQTQQVQFPRDDKAFPSTIRKTLGRFAI